MADDESTEVGFAGVGAIAQITGAETDMQIATARRYPRDLVKFKKNVKEQVCADLDTAMTMSYKLERTDADTGQKKDIVGPSVRFAEVIALAFGNMRVGSRLVDIDENFVTAQGMAWDLESNFAQTRERKGSIRKRNGQKYTQNMIQTVANKESSTAYREAVLKTIPQAHWKSLWEASREFIANASGENLAKARDRIVAYLTKHKEGVTVDQILAKFEKSKLEEIVGEDMVTLSAIANSVRDGETTPKKEFAPESASTEEKPETGKTGDLLSQMKKNEVTQAGKSSAAAAEVKPPVN